MFALVTTVRFDRQLAVFRRLHPELKRHLAGVFRDLEADPAQPHLGLQPLAGGLADLHAIRLPHAHQITVQLRPDAREVILLDVGTRDDGTHSHHPHGPTRS